VRAGAEGVQGGERRKVAFVVVGVFSWGGQDMDAIPKAFTYVANPQMRGTGPGGNPSTHTHTHTYAECVSLSSKLFLNLVLSLNQLKLVLNSVCKIIAKLGCEWPHASIL
jgi:hypothetical protein